MGTAPKKASITTNATPVAVKPQPKVDDAKVRYGRSVFKKYCDPCHPQGKQKIGPQVKGKGFSRKRIINQVRNRNPIYPGTDNGTDCFNPVFIPVAFFKCFLPLRVDVRYI